jgi:hypothetical protein
MQKFIGPDKFIVKTSDLYAQFAPEITALTDGSYVVTWVTSPQDGSTGEIHAQRFGAGGLEQGREFRIGTTASSSISRKNPAISRLADGGFVISWSAQIQDGSGWGIYAQRFTVSGEPAGSEFLVNTVTIGDQQDPKIHCLEDGGYLITWNSPNADGKTVGIYSQRFSRANARVGVETLVSTNSRMSCYRDSRTVAPALELKQRSARRQEHLPLAAP